MNKQQVLDSLKQLIPYKKYEDEDQQEQLNHIQDVIGPDRVFNDRSICAVLSAIHELTDDADIKQLALEAIWMSGRMHESIRHSKARSDVWLEILDPGHPENNKYKK